MSLSRHPSSWRDGESRVALVVAGVGVVALAWTLAPLSWMPRCVFKSLTGWPCLSCGSCRAARAVLAGHVGEALALQPLLVLTAGVAAAWVAYAWGGALLRLPRLRRALSSRERLAALGLLAALAAANWVYLLLVSSEW